VSRPRFNSKSSIPIGAKVEIAPPPPKTLNTRRQISKIKIEHYLIFSNVQKMLEREREREKCLPTLPTWRLCYIVSTHPCPSTSMRFKAPLEICKGIFNNKLKPEDYISMNFNN